MDAVHEFELVIAMLFAVIVLQYLAHRLHMPSAVALIVGGAALAFLPELPDIALDPALVLVIFLPPLLMDGAWVIPLRHLRRNLPGILSLAIGATCFTTLAVALVTHTVLPELPWAACAALGAIVSPPDAISVRAILQGMRLPRRLSILLEGESLLNDATGLVLFRFALAAAVTGSFSAVDAVGSFLLLTLGGVAVGVAVGAAWVFVARRLRDEYLVITFSVLLCWAAYLLAERLHASGVVATVVAGLISSWYQHVVFSAAVRLRGTSFWTVLIFLLEASVFMLIGSSLRDVIDRVGGFGIVIDQMAVPVLWIILGMTLARFVWICGCDALVALRQMLGWSHFEPLGWRASVVLGWAGMRGVVTLAVALSVPAGTPGRDFMLVVACAVILVTVLVQGTTLGLVGRCMAPPDRGARIQPLDMSQAALALAEAKSNLLELRAYGPGGALLHPELLEHCRARATADTPAAIGTQHHPRLQAHLALVLETIVAARAELLRLHRKGLIEDDVMTALERDLDLEEMAALSAQAN